MNTTWIPVTEKLPTLSERSESERVLVVAIVRPGETQLMIATLKPYGWVIEDDQHWEMDCVTHWMPLPDRPLVDFQNEYLQSGDWAIRVTIDGTPCKAAPSADRSEFMVQLPRHDSTVTLGSVLIDENGNSFRVVGCHVTDDGRARLRTRPE